MLFGLAFMSTEVSLYDLEVTSVRVYLFFLIGQNWDVAMHTL